MAVFVGAGMAVLASVDRAMSSLEHTRGLHRALDLARTAMSQLEAGIATPSTLNGPVAAWADGDQPALPYSGAHAGMDSGWELEVQTEPSEFAGLTKVSITALHRRGTSQATDASFTLRQLVRLGERAGDLAEGIR